MRLLIYLLLLSSSLALAEKAKPRTLTPSQQKKITTKYVNRWIPFPSFKARTLGGKRIKVKAKKGEAIALIFISSWCLPCQKIIQRLKKLEMKYTDLHTRFIYVFAHDTNLDAKGFYRTYDIKGEAIIADISLMKTFHQPDLPSIYLADRHNWLVWRATDAKLKDINELDKFLAVHTVN